MLRERNLEKKEGMEKEEGETEYEVMEKIDKEKQKIEKWKK